MLNTKQHRFVDEYLVDLNGTQAAIRAGYSPKTARAIASENLKKPVIATEVARRMDARRKRSDTITARLIWELSCIAFSDIRGIYNADGTIKNPKEWPAEVSHAVKSVRVSKKLEPGTRGQRKRVSYDANIRMHDKLKALDALAEYLGMYQRPAPQPPRTSLTVIDFGRTNSGETGMTFIGA